MNVVRLVSYFPPFEKIRHGLGPTFYYLSKEQAKLGINLHVICKRSLYEKRLEEIEGVRIHRVTTPYNVSALYELAKLDKRVKIDIVHAHATSCFSYAMFRRMLYGKPMRVKYVVHIHGSTRGVMSAYRRFIPEIFDEMKLKQRIEGLLSSLRQSIMWKGADALVAVSGALINELERLYKIPRERIHVVNNGVDLQTFYRRRSRAAILKKHGLDPDSHTILYLGGFRPVKGPSCLIKALVKVCKELKAFKVFFVGNPKHPLESAYAKPVIDQMREFKISNSIRILDNIPYHLLPKYYSAVDALVVPSIYDAFPKVILEAMACGTPVVASAVGGLTELIRNGKTGILVRPGNPDELAEAIVKTILDPDLGETLGLKARKTVEEQFTWTHVAERVMTIYKELLES